MNKDIEEPKRREKISQQLSEKARDGVAGLIKKNIELWREFGGGYYGLGAIITYFILTVQDFISAWREADSAVDFLLMEFVLDFGVDAIVNGIYAAIWPIFVIQYFS